LAWTVEIAEGALKDLAKLDKPIAKRIFRVRVGNRRVVDR
jgi:mRNA-degrading endonuclease RelE of RelBE toxin-antitoxin system